MQYRFRAVRMKSRPPAATIDGQYIPSPIAALERTLNESPAAPSAPRDGPDLRAASTTTFPSCSMQQTFPAAMVRP
jgi:hypothetical protein